MKTQKTGQTKPKTDAHLKRIALKISRARFAQYDLTAAERKRLKAFLA